MTLVLLIGLGFLGLAVVMISRAVSLSNGRPQAVQSIQGYGFVASIPADEADAEQGFLGRLADRVGGVAEGRFSGGRGLRQRLIAAGMYETPAARFVGYQVLLALGLPALWLAITGMIGAGGLAAGVGFVWAVLIGIGGPLYYLSKKVRLRQGAIERELPELIDLLVVTVEAGVGFAGAVRIAADRMTGPLGEELRLTLQEQNMGLTAGEALRNLGDRCPTDGIRIFVRSISQGESLGVSMGQIMRNVALEMRKRRRALAEERAQKAPVKMLFPLIFLIFPAMFVVLLLPAMIAFYHALSR
jgi:tight adherence protein C